MSLYNCKLSPLHLQFVLSGERCFSACSCDVSKYARASACVFFFYLYRLWWFFLEFFLVRICAELSLSIALKKNVTIMDCFSGLVQIPFGMPDWVFFIRWLGIVRFSFVGFVKLSVALVFRGALSFIFIIFKAMPCPPRIYQSSIILILPVVNKEARQDIDYFIINS